MTPPTFRPLTDPELCDGTRVDIDTAPRPLLLRVSTPPISNIPTPRKWVTITLSGKPSAVHGSHSPRNPVRFRDLMEIFPVGVYVLSLVMVIVSPLGVTDWTVMV